MKIFSKEDYKEGYIGTKDGTIKVAPAIGYYQFDSEYIRKSYLYYPFSEDQSDDSPF